MDGDGLHDIAVATDAGGVGLTITLICQTPAEGLATCGTAMAEHDQVDSLAILPGTDGARVLYSTSDDGAWIAPVGVLPCP